MASRKVQIFYASIGSGHLIAAQSIAEAIRDLDSNVEVDLTDIFRNSHKNVVFQEILAFFPNYVFPDLYTYVWKNGSLRWLYNLSCKIGPVQYSIRRKVKKFLPDVVVCTHSYPCSVISNWKKKELGPILFAVPTDLYIHPYWPSENINAFIAPTKDLKKVLIERGILPEQIYPLGIPVSPDLFRMKYSRCIGSKVNILVLAGSFRVAPYLTIHAIVKELIDYLASHSTLNISWQFVFGAAKKMENIAREKLDCRNDVAILNFPNNVHQMLATCDLVFTKPGGLTVAEALSLGKPLVLLTSGAGQERANADYVIKSGAGLLVNQIHKLIELINSIERKPFQTINQFTKENISFSKSSENIAKLIIDSI